MIEVANEMELSEEDLKKWCWIKNRKQGKIQINWAQLEPQDEPEKYLGIHPETNELIGPAFFLGRRYRIIYSSPVRLPFILPGEGGVVYHVAEIEGFIKNLFWLESVKVIICKPDDYSIRQEMEATKSVFYFFVGDQLEAI